ncbi:AAA family ATPase [Microbacterium dextranolyticum]|uniref:UDP-N-acetylglucosamine kinase n=1 Tax=Microbacterium dextranolyticum TaxID=36806 RepID=A0A9W6M6N7_9MICO|nr:adenylate kinase [Microbacterium dextranolyticum]
MLVRVRADVARLEATPGTAPVAILIDGQSGAGKTTLAARLAAAWPGDVNVVALDDVYPGWDGLDAGAETARTQILEPWCAGRTARWHRWDWARSAPGAEMTTAPEVPLIIEGSGVLTAASAALAPIRVWLESPAGTRRARALARDGDTYRPHWDRWADQERRHLDRDRPRDLATLVAEIP